MAMAMNRARARKAVRMIVFFTSSSLKLELSESGVVFVYLT
jgi:hypothetical protein